jgi:hypothetical protein
MRKRLGSEMPYMPGFAMADGDDGRIAVTLVCLFCLREQTIHVPKGRVSHDRVFWECFSCQKRERPPLPDHGAEKD